MEIPDHLVEQIHMFLCQFTFHTKEALQPWSFTHDAGHLTIPVGVVRAGEYTYNELCDWLKDHPYGA